MRLIDVEATLLNGGVGTGGAGCISTYQPAICNYISLDGNAIISKTMYELQNQIKKNIPTICSHCGAPTNPNSEKCAYCDVYY